MKQLTYMLLIVAFALTACNSSEPAAPTEKPEPQKPAVLQEAEQVEAILKEKAESDKQAIDNAAH